LHHSCANAVLSLAIAISMAGCVGTTGNAGQLPGAGNQGHSNEGRNITGGSVWTLPELIGSVIDPTHSWDEGRITVTIDAAGERANATVIRDDIKDCPSLLIVGDTLRCSGRYLQGSVDFDLASSGQACMHASFLLAETGSTFAFVREPRRPSSVDNVHEGGERETASPNELQSLSLPDQLHGPPSFLVYTSPAKSTQLLLLPNPPIGERGECVRRILFTTVLPNERRN